MSKKDKIAKRQAEKMPTLTSTTTVKKREIDVGHIFSYQSSQLRDKVDAKLRSFDYTTQLYDAGGRYFVKITGVDISDIN